jgi:hypothetical protein
MRPQLSTSTHPSHTFGTRRRPKPYPECPSPTHYPTQRDCPSSPLPGGHRASSSQLPCPWRLWLWLQHAQRLLWPGSRAQCARPACPFLRIVIQSQKALTRCAESRHQQESGHCRPCAQPGARRGRGWRRTVSIALHRGVNTTKTAGERLTPTVRSVIPSCTHMYTSISYLFRALLRAFGSDIRVRHGDGVRLV